MGENQLILSNKKLSSKLYLSILTLLTDYLPIMNYSKSLFLYIGLSFVTVITAFSQQAPSIPASFFDVSVVQNILDNDGCTAIRVYPVSDVRNNVLTTMIIGIDKDGRELSSEITPKYKYQMFKGILRGKASYDPLNSNNARSACAGYSQGNYPKFVAVFQKSTIEGMLNGNDGIGITNIYSSEENNFEATGAKLNQSDYTPAGAAVAGEPCPHMCGNPANYVCPVN
jgi:hypothetical protein